MGHKEWLMVKKDEENGEVLVMEEEGEEIRRWRNSREQEGSTK